MAETLYLRSATGQPCGPTDRRSLHALKGTSEQIEKLKSAGETWNFPIIGRNYVAGNWDANVWLKRSGGPAEARCVITHHSTPCSQMATMLDETLLIGNSWALTFFSGSSVGSIKFLQSDLLMLIVFVESGAIEIRFNDDIQFPSLIRTPNFTTVRPWEYYKRQAQRRSS